MNTQLDNIQNSLKEILPNYPVTKASLFGSVLRDDFTSTSDVDVLLDIDYTKGFSYFDLGKLEDQISSRIKRKVDLVTRNSISPHILPYIKDEVVYETR